VEEEEVYLPVVYVTMLSIEASTKRRIVGRLMNELVRIRKEAALFQPATTLALAWMDRGQPMKTSVTTAKLRAEI
jgi:hypothetical protein